VARVDYTGEAGTYRRARTLPPAVLAVWQRAVADLGLPRGGTVVDLGAGPGGFLEPLHEWFDARVVAVEPSVAMRAEAAEAGLTGRFAYVASPAEALPLRSACADVAWLSTTVHQFDDLDAAARELGRIVRPGGHVLIRGFFSDLVVTGLLATFPGIERSASTFPLTDEVVSSFARAGFTLAAIVDVGEPWRIDLTAWFDRVRRLRHVDSALRPLTDAEIELGLGMADQRYRDAPGPIASDTTLRLVVLSR
jgi:SAM-dependent methyltransferase